MLIIHILCTQIAVAVIFLKRTVVMYICVSKLYIKIQENEMIKKLYCFAMACIKLSSFM